MLAGDPTFDHNPSSSESPTEGTHCSYSPFRILSANSRFSDFREGPPMKSKIGRQSRCPPSIPRPPSARGTEMMAVPGRSGQDAQMHTAVRARLKSLGVSSSAIVEDTAQKHSPIGGECGNLIVKLPGTMRGPRRLLMAHLDTVPICVGSRPVRKRRSNRLERFQERPWAPTTARASACS